ncbi:hypothetical protein TSUD_176630 [Trifolium subterraneum]|uniref:Transcription factor IIIC subunit 5 HTH domain-containing protein n=1 Tax=Trifolium subterraneum TaxID=3900 RepID=A0A2Z6LV44_TRISU|nr:hypothetical protein TSUD_176630 [Trifolium subterraneum]
MVVSRMFEEKPIWSKNSLTERLLDKGLSFSPGMFRRLLCRIAYYFSSGPFQRFWIKKGYDPRKDPDSRIYQRIDYRVPVPLQRIDYQVPLRSSCNKLNHRWEDICAFRAFPYKFQTSLQFFELVDDYIQSEINKPPMQATCTFESGWFSLNKINCFRQRLMVRYLSIFPKPGAESLLKAATSKFEKLKRECNRTVVKLGGEECRQANTGLEESEEPANVEDEDVEAAEANNSDEEESEEELDLEILKCLCRLLLDIPAQMTVKLTLNTGSSKRLLNTAASKSRLLYQDQTLCISNPNISMTHLQELFGSFPPDEIGGDKVQGNGSEEEYHIYEEDSDNYSEE